LLFRSYPWAGGREHDILSKVLAQVCNAAADVLFKACFRPDYYFAAADNSSFCFTYFFHSGDGLLAPCPEKGQLLGNKAGTEAGSYSLARPR
jgi:hypothetical protein